MWLKQLKQAKPKTKQEALELFTKPVPSIPEKWQRWEGIVISLVERYQLPSVNRADLIQAGWMGVGQALKVWKPNRGSKLSTWVFLKVRKAITSARAKEMTLSGIGPAAWRKNGANLYCTQMPTNDCLKAASQSPYEEACNNEQTAILLESLRLLNKRYPAKEIKVLVDYLLGKPWSQIKTENNGKDMRPAYRRMIKDVRNILLIRSKGHIMR